MSTIKVDSIQATGETASRGVSGVAAAWVNLNGTGTIAIRDSMNVSSLTDSSTGVYDSNFSSNMSDANYAASGAIPYATWGASTKADFYGASETSSKMRSIVIDPFSNYYDGSEVYTIAYGDLA